jgi:hypothetical protein
MTEDLSDRLQKYLEMTKSAEEFSEFYKISKTGFEEAQAGNGWDPEEIQAELIELKHIPLEDAERVADMSKTKLFPRFYGLLGKPGKEEVYLIGEMLCWFPYWIVSGYHMCFYFRGATYNIPVNEDVVAVHVGGKIRDVHMHGQQLNGSTLISKVRRRNGVDELESTPRHIVLSGDVTELVYYFKEGSLYLDMYGRRNEGFNDLMLSSPRMSKIKRLSDLNVKGLKCDVSRSAESRTGIVKRLRERIVRPPTAFQSILENRFEITKLQKVFLPVYVFHYQYKDRIKEVRINGVTGEVMKR